MYGWRELNRQVDRLQRESQAQGGYKHVGGVGSGGDARPKNSRVGRVGRLTHISLKRREGIVFAC